MTPEGKVKKQAKAILDYFGVYYFFPASGGYGRAGVPDIIACYNGRFIGIEIKAGDNQPTALQQRELAMIRKRGGVALVINETTLDELHDTLCGMSSCT
jgi:hypothetical protein